MEEDGEAVWEGLLFAAIEEDGPWGEAAALPAAGGGSGKIRLGGGGSGGGGGGSAGEAAAQREGAEEVPFLEVVAGGGVALRCLAAPELAALSRARRAQQ